MPFWTYMLHCRGGYYYTGYTDQLETRVAAHEAGMIEGFTKDHLPVSLVWSGEFPTSRLNRISKSISRLRPAGPLINSTPIDRACAMR
ncbi:MAG: GIY-YIG nuclease family protein [Sphingomonadales bacterium]|nr:GIY-YIG nuclease family protein [Sphingomonadales bacterium]